MSLKWLDFTLAFIFLLLFCEQLITKSGANWWFAALLCLCVSLSNLKDGLNKEES